MQTRHEDPLKHVAERGVHPCLETADARSIRRTEAGPAERPAESPPQQARAGFLLVLLRALSAWSV